MPAPTVRLFAVAAPGLEEAVAAELRALLPRRVVDVVAGGAEWSGELRDVYVANVWSRVATRIYLRVGEVKAREFAALRKGVAGLPWERWITPGVEVAVTAAARKCRLYHTGAIAERVVSAIGERVSGSGSDSGSAAEVLARGEHDVFTLSIDTSGALLHKRGYREEQREAPLRETLAAAMLALAGWDLATPLLDPMCGSGTIAIEAALLASGRAPGANRSFAVESWPSHDPALLAQIRATAPNPIRNPSTQPRIFASDRDPAAIEIARRNAARAGIADLIAFSPTSVRDLSGRPDTSGMNVHSAERPGPDTPGLIITNPPYGRRIPTRRGLTGGPAGDLRQLWRSLPGWRLAVITPDRNFPSQIGARPTNAHALVNGGLKVTLFVFEGRR